MASTDNGVATTILQQLGGRRFITMTGAKNFLGSDRYLMFSLPSTRHFVKDGINKVMISLEDNDTYTVTSMKIVRRGGMPEQKTIAETSNVYFDNLQEVFTRHTGLTTRLF